MNRNALLSIIAIGVIGIFGVMAYQEHERSKSPIEKISDGVGEATEEIKDEIDDHTTSK
jgi:peroxiredoxin